jgi:hypothetical protein
VITASFNGSTKTATLSVTPLAVSSVALSPSTVLGGSANSTGTVTLNGVAPAGGATVTLSSDATSAATVPATVVIAAGASSATFTVTTLVVTSATPALITGSYNGSSQSATLNVNSYSVSSVTLSPATVIGNIANSTGTVTIGAPAPSGGLAVTLTSGNTSAATVPSSVTVLEGQTTATFLITSKSVTSAKSVVITAASGSSASATLTVNPITVSTVSLNPTSIVGGSGSVTGTVTLNTPAPVGGVTVALSSSNSAAAAVPANVVIAAGQTSNTFTITTSGVSSANSVIISATYQGSKTATLTVNSSSINSLSISMGSVVGGVGNATGTVYLSQAAPTGGAVVSLSSSNTGAITVPANFTIAAGQTSGTFAITSLLVPSNTTVTLTASYNGSKTGTIQVTPIFINSLSVSPSSLYGSQANATGTVYLNTAAPSGGIQVSLSSSDTNGATVPATVTVNAGQTSATFTITSKAVATATTVTITGSLNGTKTGTLTVNPIVVNSLSINTSTLIGGKENTTGTVYLITAAPAGGSVVELSSSSGAASVPATVTVPQGQNSVSFNITTTAVSAQTSVTFTATLNGSKTGSLTINPPSLTGISISDSSVIGGTSTTVTVSINTAAPSGGLAVTLSDNTTASGTPGTLTIPEGATSGTATITTIAVSSNTTATITAAFNGSNINSSFTVQRPTLVNFTINPSTLKGSKSTTGTVTLSGPAPTGGMVVSLGDNSTKIGTPSSVTVAAGNTTANFTMTTSSVSSTTWVTVTASLNGVSLTYDVKLTKN